jgi:hypothetical protein
MTKNGTSNYFERGEYDNECHNKFNYDPIYLPKKFKLHDSNIHSIKFSSSNCNYYERGGDKYPVYASSDDMMCSPTNDMQRYDSTFCYLFIHKMPIHKKKVRLRC